MPGKSILPVYNNKVSAYLIISGALLLILNSRLYRILKQRTIKKNLLEKGITAEALILQLERKTFPFRNSQIKMQLQVFSLSGKKFVCELNELSGHFNMHPVKSGDRISVLYNPANHKQVVRVVYT